MEDSHEPGIGRAEDFRLRCGFKDFADEGDCDDQAIALGTFEEKVVVDERLVTGQNPASAAGVAKEMEKLFAELIHQEKAQEQHEAKTLRAEKDAQKASAEAEQKD